MQRMIEFLVIILFLDILFLTIKAIGNYDEPEEEPVIFKVKATAYCTGTTTATQCRVREGIIAGKPEWFGKVAAIYEADGDNLGEFLGYFECLDTGGEAIKQGKVIDIYNPSYDWCIDFGEKDVYMILIDGEG